MGMLTSLFTKHLNNTTCQSIFAWVLLHLFDLQCSSCLSRRFAIDGLRSAKTPVMPVLLSSMEVKFGKENHAVLETLALMEVTKS